MRALILGGTGFVGAVLARRLWADGHQVTVVSRGQTPDLLPRDITRLRVDRFDRERLGAALAGRSFDVVYDIHLMNTAADPQGQSCRAVYDLLGERMKHYVLVSTVGVYGYDPYTLPIAETHPLQPVSDFHHHKLAAETVVGECGRRAGIPTTIVRLNRIVGPRDSWVRRVSHLFERVLAGAPILVPGSLTTRIDVIYVEDVARALARVPRRLSPELVRVYNVTGPSFVLGELLEGVFSATGRRVPVRQMGFSCQEESDAWGGLQNLEWWYMSFRDYHVDSSRARQELGWAPRVTVREAMHRVWRWIEAEQPALVRGPAQSLGPLAEAGRLVEVPELPPLPLDPRLAIRFGDILEDSEQMGPPAGPGDADAAGLDASELALLLSLGHLAWTGRGQLQEEAARLAQMSGLGRGVPAATLDSLLGRELVAVRDIGDAGEQEVRITARGYLAALSAAAHLPADGCLPDASGLLLRYALLVRLAYLRWVVQRRPATELVAPPEPATEEAPAGQELLAAAQAAFPSFADFAAYFQEVTALEPALGRWLRAFRLTLDQRAARAERLQRAADGLGTELREALEAGPRGPGAAHPVGVTRGDELETLWVRRASLELHTLVLPDLARLGSALQLTTELLELARQASGDQPAR